MEPRTEILDEDVGAVHFEHGVDEFSVVFGIGDVSESKVCAAKDAIIERRTWESQLNELCYHGKQMQREIELMEKYPEMFEAATPEFEFK